MKKLKIDFEHCHGINKLDYTFDFTDKNYIIYATNGSMKTSFFNTISEYIKGIETKDEFFPDRITKRLIKDENNLDINRENIIVIGNDDFSADDKITSLLANRELKEQYDKIYTLISGMLEKISKKIKTKSGVILDEMLKDLNIKELHEISDYYLTDENVLNFHNIKYNKLFTEDNIRILNQSKISNVIKKYVAVCDEIIKQYPLFVTNIFELHNLKSVKKSLDANSYFEPGHLIKLMTNSESGIFEDYDSKKLDELILDIDNILASDEKIVTINQDLTGKIKSQQLNSLLLQNQWIIPYLDDINILKKHYWHFLIASNIEIKDLIKEYLKIYKDNSEKLKQIVELSNSKENYKQWEEAIKIFNNKFIDMPFTLSVKNLSDVILKEESCSLIYQFKDSHGTNPNVDKEKLKSNLSKGERKALSILNFIFEIQFRKQQEEKEEVLIVIDDVADSFDYKNKYAIVEYLKELNDDDLFKLIILTHNFDFYRTCAKTLNLKGLNALKNDNIIFADIYFRKNIFNYFKDNINEEKYFIASIPFVRNIIEMTEGEGVPFYQKLTSALHYKSDTDQINIDDISSIFSQVLKANITIKNRNYIDLLFETADNFSMGNTRVNLSNKLVLSIAIRIKLEKFLATKINNWGIINDLKPNQTRKMINYCKKHKLISLDDLKIAEKVIIMSSENIHVNSFMYEPIIDMSDDELINLYNDVKSL